MGRNKTVMQPFWRACAVGLAVSALMAGLYVADPGGRVQRFENLSLDLRFDFANRRMKPFDDIRLVAIDDQALLQMAREYGRYPWPRRVFADLVSVLAEAGAQRIALDLHFPEALRVVQLPTGSPALQDASFQDDAAFAAAIARAGNAYLPMVCDAMPGRYDMDRITTLGRQIGKGPQRIDDQTYSRQLGLPLPLLGEDAFLRSRVASLLRERFWLTDEQLADTTGFGVESIRRSLGTVRRQVAKELVDAQLLADPQATTESICRALEKDAPAGARVNREEINWGLDLCRIERIVQPNLLPLPQGEPTALPQIRNPFQVQLPIGPLAEAASGFGHVVFVRDSDGSVRRLPLLIRWGQQAMPQMALRIATDLLDLRWNEAHVTSETITVPGRRWDPQRRAADPSSLTQYTLHLDETGQTLINWTKPGADWRTCFEPVPAGMVLAVAQRRHEIQRNEAWLATRTLALVQRTQQAELAHYQELKEKERQLLAPSLAQTSQPVEKSLHDQLQQIRTLEKRIETASIELLRQNDPQEIEALVRQTQDPAERADLAMLRDLYEDFAQDNPSAEASQGKLARTVTQTNAQLAKEAAWQMDLLRKQLTGRIAFVGCTATALGDVVSTPVWNESPGVMSHAQMLNGILQNRSIQPIRLPTNTSIVLLCCLLVTVVTAWLGPRESLAAMVLACAAYAAVAMFVLFERYGVAITLATPVTGMFVTWAMITAYRQLIEERAKRHFSRTLQQYTSPALARRMAEDPEAVTRAEAREVSCFFSDLKGFTTISERMGPAATQKVLNIYLERMTEVLDGREALINKFLGDGIFAFFNPAIHPQADHAQRACLAALEATAALEQLKREPQGESCRDLYMRIGLASGQAIVGNCGSERKFDYTCIGDTVNLASRLEGANKTFGTAMLINARCRELAGPAVVCRHIGRIIVAGRAAYEETHELIGRREDVGSMQIERIQCFEDAVRCFIAGNLPRAKAGFEECLRQNATDTAARAYINLCDRHMATAVPADWNGAVEMTGK